VKRIKVLHVIYSLGSGGAERVVVNYGLSIDKDRFDMAVCALTEGGHYEAALKDHSVDTFLLGKKKGFDSTTFQKLYRLFRSQEVDIVHFHDPPSSYYGVVPAKLAGVKVIIRTEHNVLLGKDFVSRVQAALSSLSLLFHHKIIAVSTEVSKASSRNEHFLPGRHTTIHNGVDPEMFDITLDKESYLDEFDLHDKSVIIGIVARFEPQKAHEIFLQSVRRVLDKRKDVGVLIVGDGFRRDELQGIADDLGLRGRVIFTGVRGDVPQLLHLMDIFVLSSDWEGFPMTILEAMACGTPVVVTDVGGSREAVVDGETGLLVPPRDPEGLAKAITTLIEDPESRAEMGKKARQRFLESFTVDVMARETEQVYETFLRQ